MEMSSAATGVAGWPRVTNLELPMTAEETGMTPEQVVALEDVRYAAMIGGDLDSLERLFADDMAYTHSPACRPVTKTRNRM
jgi:hypothetical protein